MVRIDATLLIPGDGEPIADGTVIFDRDAGIGYAGPRSGAPDIETSDALSAAVVMPGLWDCHTHFMGTRNLGLDQMIYEPGETRAVRGVADMRAALDAGVTSVREVGGLGLYLKAAVEDGSVDGPNIFAAGALLSTTAGHGDFHSLPLCVVNHFARHGGYQRLCDGVDDCMRAVREQLRRGASLIKVCATGGTATIVDDPQHQQFTMSELRAIVETAALADRVVAAHCHGKAGIMAALEAGARTIEHGTYLDDESCDAMVETGAVLVPTLTIIDEISSQGGAPAYATEKMRVIAERHRDAVHRAHERGVTIANGSDIAFSATRSRPSGPGAWGNNGHELALLVECGLSPLQAIRAATAHGPLTLGPQAPRSGRLAVGHDADVITLDADPLSDITVLMEPARVTGVWVGGRRVKSPIS